MPPPFRIANATLIFPDRLVPDGALDVADGRIVAAGTRAGLPASNGMVVDARGAYAAPGYIDMHVHGGGNADFMDGTAEAFEAVIRAHTRHGVTSIIPTSTVARHEQSVRFLELSREFHDRGAQPDRGLARVIGAHLYGPWFAEEKVGCHPKLPARPPTRDDFERYLDFADIMLTATCAPELPGAADFYRAAAAKGVRLNAGHSEATWTEMAAAYELGVRHVDHFYSAMSSVTSLRARCGTPMQASMMEFVLATDDMTTEIISDGRHLSPELLRFVLKMKGPDRTALVSDCNRALDLPPGTYIFGPLDGGEPFVNDGGVGLMPDGSSLASSVRGLDFMVRHLHRAAGVDLPTAVRMASLTPAKIVGKDREIGSLEAGKRADFLLLDEQLEVREVYVGGERVTLA
jgi:N-acetylglucosamine-6-phosphate deacetylase